MSSPPTSSAAEHLSLFEIAVDRSDFHLGPISLRVEAGQLIGIVGDTGSGKSTFLKALCGLLPLSSGLIKLGASFLDSSAASRKNFQKKVALSFQQGALLESLTVLENVLLAAKARDIEEPDKAARFSLHQVGLLEAAHSLPVQLSGGMRRRVGIARALATSPALLLIDDVTADLDPLTGKEVMEEILKILRPQAPKNYNEEKAHSTKSQPIVLLSTHDVDVVLPFVDSVVLLEAGEIRFFGPPSEIPDAYGFYHPRCPANPPPPPSEWPMTTSRNTSAFEYIGSSTLNWMRGLGEFVLYSWRIIRRTLYFDVDARELLRQLDRLCLRSLPLLLGGNALVGGIIAMQGLNYVARYNATEVFGWATGLSAFKEVRASSFRAVPRCKTRYKKCGRNRHHACKRKTFRACSPWCRRRENYFGAACAGDLSFWPALFSTFCCGHPGLCVFNGRSHRRPKHGHLVFFPRRIHPGH
ncbi:MAG: ATP-binding cassette domain-containing protein [Deltaproteobacteria bacterium]|nr:ATP-binding cassette domain-containing protein [Deltaproteobacteria bacterium]